MLGHALRRALRSLWENLWLNAVSVLVIATGLLLVGVAWTVQHNLDSLVATWGQDVHVSAYLRAGVADEASKALAQRIGALPEVQRVDYISSEEAQRWLSERVEGLSGVLGELGPDALPASLEITLKAEVLSDPAAVRLFAESLPRDEIEELDYGTGWVERFRAFLSLLRVMGGVLGALILASAAFVVVNTVHLIVYSRRDEVEIQKMVGGTPAFIIAPFAIEGLIQGLVGALLAATGLSVVHYLVVDRLRVALAMAPETSLLALPGRAMLTLALAGALVGLGASTLSAWRFLRRAP